MSRVALLLTAALSITAVTAVFTQPPPKPAGPEPVRGEWTMYGGTPSRNMVNLRDKLPRLPLKEPNWENSEATKQWEAEWLRWKADLGTRSYTQPVIAGGKVFVGTNNERPRNKRDRGKPSEDDPDGPPIDKGILMCYEAKSGKFLWQAVHDKLDRGAISDWPREGLCSTPAIVGDRVYYVSSQCRVVCLDVNGLSDGNQGVQTEQFKDATDADVVWEYDMIRELKVFPHMVAAGCPLIIGDLLFTITGNGVDENHLNVANPEAPSFLCLNRHTGKVVWKDNSPGKDIMHGQWASPAYASGPVPQVIFPGGDGWLRAFDPPTGKLLWKFDCNPKGATYNPGGRGRKNDFLASPVVSDDRLYIGTGQDPEHFEGEADLWCIDLKKAVGQGSTVGTRDVSPTLIEKAEKLPKGKDKVITKPNPASAMAWHYGGPESSMWSKREFKFGRTISTLCVIDDVLYAPELAGYLHCLDAKTGKHYWEFDTRAAIWGSPYYADGRVLLANEDGVLFIFKHTKEQSVFDEAAAGDIAGNAAEKKALNDGQEPDAARKAGQAASKQARKQVLDKFASKFLLSKIEFDRPIRNTPTVADGVLYVPTEQMLFSFGKAGE